LEVSNACEPVHGVQLGAGGLGKVHEVDHQVGDGFIADAETNARGGSIGAQGSGRATCAGFVVEGHGSVFVG